MIQRYLCVALFLFVSGFCSLAYQVVWLREFRLVFGGSTLAASAVLAVFMGALGMGSWVLGRKADNSPQPGRFYAIIELLIGLTVLISPLLLTFGKKLYYMTGGMQELGWLAIALQMLITIGVIALPCFLMGGTLPAAIRVIQTDEDTVRRASAVMYGVNIAGAVIGALLVNFYGLEVFGNTKCLLMAAGLNIILGVAAYLLIARHQPAQALPFITQKDHGDAWLLYGVAFASGFIFFALELLWFRSSIPLLGGSVYNFGLILALALMGMSMGGLIYSVILKYAKPSYALLGIVSVLFALTVAIPYTWGDGYAHFCSVLQAGYIGYPFADKLWVWFVIGGFLVLPTAVMAGIQFPLILSLIGKGRDGVGRQIGRVYAFNTAGAVAGSILGGFVFIPKFSITNTWLLMIALALAVAVIVAGVAIAKRARLSGAITIGMACGIVMLAIQGSGLTAYWLHNPIGFGRTQFKAGAKLADIEHLKRSMKRVTLYQYDGREISGSLQTRMDLALINNGKSDGSALGDAGTQIMLSLLGSLLHHGDPKHACVIGLGTGTSAGWLAQVPSIESLDVFELEPHLVDCARYYAPVNYDVVNNPKVNIILGDARESLMASKGKKYDLIASEPSNPQRAGVANLYTQEYYQTAADRLHEDGVFTQWLQAYEIEVDSVHLIMVTLRSVFPQVCVYQTQSGDLVFVCFKHRKPLHVEAIRQKLKQHPYPLGVDRAWGVKSVEGVLAHSLANSVYVDKLTKVIKEVNTDDRNLLEFTAGRSGGASSSRSLINVILSHTTKPGHLVEATDGSVSNLQFSYAMATAAKAMRQTPAHWKGVSWFNSNAAGQRYNLYTNMATILKKDPLLSFDAMNSMEEVFWAKAMVEARDQRCLSYAEQFKDTMPLDYRTIRLSYYWATGDTYGEDREIIALIETMTRNIWHLPQHSDLHQSLKLIIKRTKAFPERLKGREREVLALLEKPFDAHVVHNFRMMLRWIMAERLGAKELLPVLLDYEPHFPFNEEAKLKKRVEVYRELGHANLERAEKDWHLYLKWR